MVFLEENLMNNEFFPDLHKIETLHGVTASPGGQSHVTAIWYVLRA